MTTRTLEMVKAKSGKNAALYDYVIEKLRPTLTELGVNTPEELGL